MVIYFWTHSVYLPLTLQEIEFLDGRQTLFLYGCIREFYGSNATCNTYSTRLICVRI